MAKASGGPSGDLGLDHDHSGVAVTSGHMNGGTTAHRARRQALRSDKTTVHDGSPSLVMVLGLMDMRKHVLEGDDGT